MNPITTDVLIVGAGPTGLSLGAQLNRYGVDFALVDKKQDVTDLSKALAVHARSLEVYDQLGLAEAAVREGEIVQHAALMAGGKVYAKLDLTRLGDLSPFPFVLIFEQSKNERLLRDHLRAAGKEVLWQTELKELSQGNDGRVHAVLATSTGETQLIDARYVVGCDGAGSAVRHALQLPFEGSTFPRLFYVADVEMDFPDGEPGTIYAAFTSGAFTLFFPMTGERHYRLIGPLPEHDEALRADPAHEPDVQFEAVEAKVKSSVQRPLTITRKRWFSTYKVHTRRAATFRKGNCFLAGDAAHVHSPAGGQGMNTGIQDAYNLAWKLALVLRGYAKDALLDTYDQERLENAKRLLRTTDEAFDVMAGDHWYTQWVRDYLLPPLAGVLWRFQGVREVVFSFVSQIAITYRDSPLSSHADDRPFKPQAGDRLPFFHTAGRGIFELLRAPTFHVLLFTTGTSDPASVRTAVESRYADIADVHEISLDPRIADLFGTSDDFLLLLRPDNHIALLSPRVAVETIDAYFDSVIKK